MGWPLSALWSPHLEVALAGSSSGGSEGMGWPLFALWSPHLEVALTGSFLWGAVRG